jgi:hypothetical protein
MFGVVFYFIAIYASTALVWVYLLALQLFGLLLFAPSHPLYYMDRAHWLNTNILRKSYLLASC